MTTVKCFKLLGVNISDDLRWDAHIDALFAKTATRLYFLKILKRSGLVVEDLVCFYECVIRADRRVRLRCIAPQSDRCTEQPTGGPGTETGPSHYLASVRITPQ